MSNKRKRSDKNKKVPIVNDKSTKRGDAVTLPTSPVPKSKKLKTACLLVDTTNTAPAVQPKGRDILAPSIPEKNLVSGKDEQTKKFEELINKGAVQGSS